MILRPNPAAIRGPRPTLQRTQPVDFSRDRFSREMGQRSSTEAHEALVNAAGLAARQQALRDQFNHGDRGARCERQWRAWQGAGWVFLAGVGIFLIAQAGAWAIDSFLRIHP